MTATRTSRLIVILLCVLLVGCDHGGVVLAENQTDDELLARAQGISNVGSGVPPSTEIVAVLAPDSKLVIAELPFTGGFRIQHLDILRADCSLVDGFSMYGDTGTYVVIDDDSKVTVRKDFPEKGTLAATTDRCRTIPALTTSPSAGPSAVATGD